MDKEYQSLIENDTWTLVNTPLNRKVLRGKWVYKLQRWLNCSTPGASSPPLLSTATTKEL